MTWQTLVASLFGAFFTGGAAVAAIRAIAARRVTSADVISRLSDMQLDWVREFQEDAASARDEATHARTEAGEARRESREATREATETQRQMRAVQKLADELEGRLRDLIIMIHDPRMSLERLREIVPKPHGRFNDSIPPE